MWKVEKVPNIHFEEQVDLIYDLKFQEGNGNLDYLHLIRQLGYFATRNRPGDVMTLAESEQIYNNYLPEMIRSFRVYCQAHRLLFPDAVIRVPTTRPQLQEPVFTAFFELFPDTTDLSDCLEINLGGEGIEKFMLTGRNQGELNEAGQILIIDDVYADGNAYASVVNKCGNKKYLILCPLFFEKDVVHKLRELDWREIVRQRLEERNNE